MSNCVMLFTLIHSQKFSKNSELFYRREKKKDIKRVCDSWCSFTVYNFLGIANSYVVGH